MTPRHRLRRPGRRRPGRRSGPPAACARGSGGIGRSSSAGAEAVSDDLRRGAGDWLEHRRRLGALYLSGMGAFGVVAAYQLGLLRRPPEPGLPGLDAARVDASGEAYALARTPDAALGLVSHAATLVLAGMGDRHRSTRHPLLPLLLAAKVVVDAAGSGLLTVEQATKHRRFCGWCLLAAATTVAAVPSAVPEASAAWRHLRNGRRRRG